MQPIPYLYFPYTAEEAITAYARIFGTGEPQIMRASDAPSDAGPGGGVMRPDAVMHAALKVGDGWLYASDYQDAQPMAGSQIALSFDTTARSREVFDALAEGGTVEMPFEPTFWSPGFGAVVDRWGTRWAIDTGSEEGVPT
jgi:PhnB protein